MKVKIFFTVNEVEDYFLLSGNLSDIQEQVICLLEKRNLNQEVNNVYSEVLEE